MTKKKPFYPDRGGNSNVAPGAASDFITVGTNCTQVRFVNTGANICYVRIGTGMQEATIADTPILPGFKQAIVLERAQDQETIAFISAAGTTLAIQTCGSGISVAPVSMFLSRWFTEAPGPSVSLSTQILLPLNVAGTYNFLVDWGDGTCDTITTWNQAETLHTYAVSGVKTVTITGTISGWAFLDGGDAPKLLDIMSFGPLNLGNSSGYFHGCLNLGPTLTAPDSPDLTGTTTLKSLFDGCSSLVSAPSLNTWDVSGINDMEKLANECTLLNVDLPLWDVSSVLTLSDAFKLCPAFDGDITTWLPSSCADFSNMLQNCDVFNKNINNWDMSSAINLSFMLFNAFLFNQPLNLWDVSSVQNMQGMLRGTSFNQPIDSWNVSSVVTMTDLFRTTPFNQILSSWNTISAQNMNGLFWDNFVFNQNISTWNLSSVITIENMIRNATSYNQPVNLWDVSSVQNMAAFALGASSFDQPVNSWITSSLQSLSNSFRSTPFNQDMSGFNVTGLTTASNILLAAASFSTANYDLLLVGWEAQAVQNGVTFGTLAQYSAGAPATAHAALIADHSWTIDDGGPV